MKTTIFLLDRIVGWLIIYRYYLLIPVIIIEGPIITVIAGFLASMGYFNILIVYGIVVFLDISEDIFLYLLGWFWGNKIMKKFGHYIGMNQKRLLIFSKQFKKHRIKTIAIGKMAIVMGVASFVPLIAAGMTKMPFRKFISVVSATSLVKSMALLLIGFYFGKAYILIDKYLNYIGFAAAAIALLIFIVYFVVKLITKRILSKG